MSETAAAAFREFLSGHMVVSILVLPGACTGLDDFPRAVPLRLDLSHSFSPPMWAEPSDAGLDFHASFNRVSRAVHVPWTALLWAGIPGTDSGKTPTQKAVAALPARDPAPLPPPDPPFPKVTDGNVVHVNFRKGRI